MEIKTKYNIGDKVYAIHEGKIRDFIVYRVFITAHGDYTPSISYAPYHHDEFNRLFDECEVFPTKEELLKSL